jgi:7,8-dihydropterin-6-yl-methyl-4-(beta-D-ribofuranosyl)aminobenzene 5'-phosphate synthase
MPSHNQEGKVKRTLKMLLLAGSLYGVALLAGCAMAAETGADEAAKPHSQDNSRQIATPRNQITVLYDAFGRESTMRKDWGFSALVEVGGKRILFDTGNNSDILAHNVKADGADLTELDFVIMSHRHGDHMGGLNYLMSVNPNVPVYAPKENFGVFGSSFPGSFYRRNESLPPDMRYFDGEPPETLRFGTPWPRGEFSWVAETSEVVPGFHLILLKGSWGVDLDVMEISLAIETPQGIVLVVGCGHPTIERIVEAATTSIDKPTHLVIGGLHLLPANDEETQRIATTLRDRWKVEWIAPDHCTGEPAFEILKRTFGDRYLYAGVGTTVEVGAHPVSRVDQHDSSSFNYETDLQGNREVARSNTGATDHK